MYNLIEYSKNYRKTTGSFWNYYRDDPNDFHANNYNANPITSSGSFKYKSSITGKTSIAIQESSENTEQVNIKTKKNLGIVAPLKHLNNFSRTLNMPLINCEVSLTLTWSENCVLTYITTQAARNPNPNADPAVQARERIYAPAGPTFQIADTKLYIPVVTLSTKNDKKPLEQLNTRFKRTIKWNRYKSKMTNQTKINNLNCLVDPTFTKVNGLFVLSFENENDRTSFSKYYVPNVQNVEETFEQIIEMGTKLN